MVKIPGFKPNLLSMSRDAGFRCWEDSGQQVQDHPRIELFMIQIKG